MSFMYSPSLLCLGQSTGCEVLLPSSNVSGAKHRVCEVLLPFSVVSGQCTECVKRSTLPNSMLVIAKGARPSCCYCPPVHSPLGTALLGVCCGALGLTQPYITYEEHPALAQGEEQTLAACACSHEIPAWAEAGSCCAPEPERPQHSGGARRIPQGEKPRWSRWSR